MSRTQPDMLAAFAQLLDRILVDTFEQPETRLRPEQLQLPVEALQQQLRVQRSMAGRVRTHG
jgi:hypothetical protein